MVSHKPGTLKQPKKAHKHGKHKSKGILATKAKGRLGVVVNHSSKRATVLKRDRKNTIIQKRKLKQGQIAEEKREMGGSGQPPISVIFVPSHEGINVKQILETLKSQGEVYCEGKNGYYFYCKRLNKRFHFLTSDNGLLDLMDMAKCADLLVMVWDQTYNLDMLLKTCLFSQGLPAIQHVVYGDSVKSDRDKINRKKTMMDILDNVFNDNTHKVHYLDSETDVSTMVWGLVNFKKQKIGFTKHRAYMISSHVAFDKTNDDVGILKVSGYIRGTHLDANQLVHIPELGHFRIHQITSSQDPCRKYNSNMFEEEVLSVPTDPPSLDMESPVDEMDAEQTWPTEEDFEQAELKNKNIRRVPKGTSSYQAVWMESDDEDSESLPEAHSESESESDEEFEDIETESQAPTECDYDVNFDEEREAAELRKFREAREHEEFPDEIDTPIDTPARVRFQKYRGLKSFRTTPWDPKENLPLDYARIWQIRNFTNMRKYILKSHVKESLSVKRGMYVTIHIENVPVSITESSRSALSVFSLLPHEQRMCVQHAALRRHPQSDMILKSKEQILAQVGFRRYCVTPIYSQHTKSNKHKFERYMPQSGSFVASYYAPITFSNSPVIFFKREDNGTVTLLSTGSMLSCDPDRVICKRVVLSGHPFKINKRTATIRYMLYNREDIAYFKPVELRTKFGRRGHIREALGTHGHMKVGFDGAMAQNDTVIMCLYKRVFPKWHFSYS